MKKAAGYARVSSEKQFEEGSSLESQRDRIIKRAKDEGYELVKIYSDVYSGANTRDRPGFQEMLAAAKAKQFDGLIFTKLDRLGRSLADILASWDLLVEKLHITLISLDDSAISSEGMAGKIVRAVLALISEIERDLIRERTSAGRMRRWRAGECNLGSIAFGYKKVMVKNRPSGEIVIDPEQAATYKKMISLYLHKRLSLAQIADVLNRDGDPSPGFLRAKKKPRESNWTAQAVHSVMSNSVYMGVATYNQIARDVKGRKMVISKSESHKGRNWALKDKKEWLTKKFEPLIKKKTFDAVQARLNQKRRRPMHQSDHYKDHFLLHGLAYCGECGALMRKLVRLSSEGTPRLHQYLCGAHGRDKKKCGLLRVDANTLDDRAWGQMIHLLMRPDEFVKAFLKDEKAADLLEKKTKLETSLKETEGKITKGFQYLQTVDDPDRRAKYEIAQRKLESVALQTEAELKKTTAALDLIAHRQKRLDQFKKGVSERVGFKEKVTFAGFLNGLSFEERRRVIEGIISPETGGKITIGFTRPKDFLDESEHSKDQTKPLKDRPYYISLDFEVDPDKIESVILSLDRSKVQGCSDKAVPDRPDDPKRFTGKRQARHLRGDGR
jgi:site-specific DNA recombinase